VVNATAEATRAERAWAVLDGVPDPEVPAISVRELGIVREVLDHGTSMEVVLTPTYSGCPATEVIERSVCEAIDAAGLGPARVTMRRAPAWTTDWISEHGKRKLRDYGIAPPGPVAADGAVPIRIVGRRAEAVACPRCGSARTERLSAFGSTACKALWRCLACREPFEQFKAL
jgi:ring-1,2-phenylacetyl-CoA epoxidase subunit PaaD